METWWGEAVLRTAECPENNTPYGGLLRTAAPPVPVPLHLIFADPVHFTGKPTDLESGFVFFGARHYTSRWGGWLNPDPVINNAIRLFNPQALNLNSYVGGNPLAFIDPDGQEWYYNRRGREKKARWHFIKNTASVSPFIGTTGLPVSLPQITVKGKVEALSFDGNMLSWHRKEGDTKEWRTVSGRLDETGKTQPQLQWKKDEGPIPESRYLVNPREIQNWADLSLLQKGAAYLRAIGIKAGPWPGGPPAWGEHRVPLYPSKVGNRSNFFIHGGSFPGSSGCIDLTNMANDFFQHLGNQSVPLELFVNYGQ